MEDERISPPQAGPFDWASCPRGDQMLALLGRQALNRPDARCRLATAAAECAALSLPYAGEDEGILRSALMWVYAWVRGTTSAMEGRLNVGVPLAKLSASKNSPAVWAVHAAVMCAAEECPTEIDLEWLASRSASAAATAANWAVADKTRTHEGAVQAKVDILRQCADIVRRHYPEGVEHATG